MVTAAPAMEPAGASYFLTLILFVTVLPPAFREVTLKVALTLPRLFGLSLILTLLVLPPSILPTDLPALMPLPRTLNLTPFAPALPALEILIR